MNCPNCQTEKPEGARFCFNCGTKLILLCPQCETENPLQARFCFNCGHHFNGQQPLKKDGERTPPTADAQRMVPNHLIPRAFADKLKDARVNQAMQGERRVVTLLFCDVVGSTSASEQLDPEEWTEVMNGAFERMIAPIYHYEGTVARLMGDAILAFFGAPIAHEDDPQRAVLAGLDIVESIKAYREKASLNWGVDFDVRVGINTGLVVVGAVGSDLRMEYTAMGDAINLAARMEQTAAPGTVQIAQETYKQVSPFFELQDLGGIEVKGKQELVQAYQVLGRKATPGRLRGIDGLDAPLVGREREKALLEDIISKLDKGIGRIVCLVGEAGLGKSRLISELRESSIGKQWHETASLSYETGQPYSLFQRLIRRMVAATAGDPPERLRDKIGALVKTFPSGEQEDVHHLFESLFGLVSQSGQAPLEGEAFKGRLFTVMSTLLSERISQEPVILVCDDLHWSDPASVALLIHLLPLTEQGPLLILCAMRPDTHSQGWWLKQAAETDFSHRHTEVQLQALSLEEGSQLVDSLLTVSDLPARLRARILDKTEGNPFFVEEVVRSLIEGGAIVRDESGNRWQATGEGEDIEIPGNVQALLTARIDRLGEDVRNTLQVASVVGRTFYYLVLARIVEGVEDLDEQLLTLTRTQFIQESARRPELEYSFRHALTQEAAYSTVLLRQRRSYHQKVGETLESLFPEQHEELAGSLALHFYHAQDYLCALRYHTLAGDVAFRLYAPVEAIDHYSQAIECAGKVKLAGTDQLVHIYSRRGRAYELDSQFNAALDNYRQMVELAQERDDKALLLSSLTAQCIVHATQTPLYDPVQAKALGEEALKLARELGDRAAEARVLWGLLLVEVWGGGDNEQALLYGQQSLAIARENGLTEQMGYTLTNLVNVFWLRDQYEAARKSNQEARAAWLEVNNTPMLADSYTMFISVNQFAGDYEGALAAAQDALRISQSIGNMWNQTTATFNTGEIFLDQGDIGRAYDHLERGLALAEEAGITSFKYRIYSHLIMLYLTVGALEEAEPLAEEIYWEREQLVSFFYAINLSQVAQLKIAQGKLEEAAQLIAEAYQGSDAEGLPLMMVATVLKVEAMLQLAQGRPEQALESALNLADRSRSAGTRHFLPEALLVQGKALAALEEYEQAAEVLREAAAVAEEIGQRRALWQILAVLAEIEMEQGNNDEARALRGRAREVVDYMDVRIGSEELRASFLSQPDVQAVLANQD